MRDLKSWPVVAGLALVLLICNGCSSTRAKDKGTGGKEVGRITSGSYSPPWIANLDSDTALAAKDNALPPFTGSLFGIYLHPDSGDPVPPRFITSDGRCAPNRIQTESLQTASGALAIVAPYLPPGTFEPNPATLTKCDDGRLLESDRSFELPPQPVFLEIRRTDGKFAAVIQHVSRSRVTTGELNGKEVVLVHPVAPDGWGDSAVIVKGESGITAITAVNLPFDEVLKIAKGVIGA